MARLDPRVTAETEVPLASNRSPSIKALREANNQQAIFRLGPEVLAQILQDVFNTTQGSQLTLNTWIMNVSFGFLEIIKSTPPFWTKVDAKRDHVAAVRVAIIRSKNLPLKITGLPGTKEDINAILLGEATRWKSVTLLPGPGMPEAGLPILEALVIDGSTKKGEASVPVSLTAKTPMLQQLVLRCCLHSEWQSRLLPTLRSLVIQDFGTEVTFADFLKAVSKLPNLEELELLRPRFTNINPPSENITLKQLRRLAITFDEENVVQYVLKGLLAPNCHRFIVSAPCTKDLRHVSFSSHRKDGCVADRMGEIIGWTLSGGLELLLEKSSNKGHVQLIGRSSASTVHGDEDRVQLSFSCQASDVENIYEWIVHSFDVPSNELALTVTFRGFDEALGVNDFRWALEDGMGWSGGITFEQCSSAFTTSLCNFVATTGQEWWHFPNITHFNLQKSGIPEYEQLLEVFTERQNTLVESREGESLPHERILRVELSADWREQWLDTKCRALEEAGVIFWV